jgi:homopolymeric O-antigen transport system permease protein
MRRRLTRSFGGPPLSRSVFASSSASVRTAHGAAAFPGSARDTVVKPVGRWSALELRDLWRYRDLLYILAWRDVKVRYKQAALGGAWAVLQPLILMGLFTLVFRRIGHVQSQGVPYPVFAFVGLVPWMLFSNTVSASANSIISSKELVSKVYFPRLVIPIASVLAWTPDFVIGSVLLFGIMGIYGVVPPVTAVLLPIVMAAALLAASSVGIWFSALNVAYRDMRYVVPFLVQMGMFLTPVAYPASEVPAKFRWVPALNPMSWVINVARWAVIGTPIAAWVTIASATTMIVVLVGGLYYFRRVQHFFADVI